MKRTLLLLALFITLGAGAWYAWNVRQNQKQGSRVSWDMDFAVPDTESIGKIFLADRKGNTVTLVRGADGVWTFNGGQRARPTAVATLLETIAKVNVWYIPPEAAEKTMVKSVAADGIKVEIYDRNGKALKTYYVGGVTNDEHGTYFMMEGAEQPYVVHVPSFVGALRVRYGLGDDFWRDRTVFYAKAETIRSIAVEYPQQKSASFRLEKTGDLAYTVKPFFSTTPASKMPQRKGAAEAYLLNFENKGAEAFETLNPVRDSVVNLVPFAIVTLQTDNGPERRVRFWPRSIDTNQRDGTTYVDRYFAETENGLFVLVQDRVFGPIFKGYDSFFERPGGLRQ